MISFPAFFAITISIGLLVIAIAVWLYRANDGFDVEKTSRKALGNAIRNLKEPSARAALGNGGGDA